MADDKKDTKAVDKEAAAKEEQARLDKEAEERIKEWEKEVAMGPFAGGPMLLTTLGEVPNLIFEIFSGIGGYLVVKTDRGEVKAQTGDYIFMYDNGPGKRHFGVLTKEVAEAILGYVPPPPAGDPAAYMSNKQWVDELERRRKLEFPDVKPAPEPKPTTPTKPTQTSK